MIYKHDRTFFRKIVQVINPNLIKKLIDKYDADYRVQHFDTLSHLYALLIFQIKGMGSLRELQTQISSNTRFRKLVNVPSVSQFSRKNASRDYRFFEDIFKYLVNYAIKNHGNIKVLKDIAPLKIVDSTVIELSYKLCKQYRYDSSRSGVKVSTLFNGIFPEKVHIVSNKVNDRKCIDGFFTEETAIYVFDRGYYDYRWYDKLTEKGIKFVTRGIKNASVMEEEFLSSLPEQYIYDTKVTIGSTAGGNLSFNQYREIMGTAKDEEPIYFLTNMFDLETQTIIDIYKMRWKIETFFKWLKQNLRIKKCIGYSENSIKIQIYTALISYLLLYILGCRLCPEMNMLKVTRIVKVNLVEDQEEGLLYLSG